MIDPNNDGIDHINIYSKGKTKLGQFLTNFAYSPIETEDGWFQSIEGYWYWLSCKNDKLRDLYGWKAKVVGRELGGKDWMDDEDFKRKILAAIDVKLRHSPHYFNELRASQLPLKHYYVYGGKVVEPKDGKWILDHLSKFQKSDPCCDECGETKDVSFTADPYIEEIANRTEMKHMCPACYRNACLEI